ncbi:Uncharacterized protein involved in outer membrane biogenesis [Arboricoccus pini]|uniref:Uncharacterized protein involved in outer membrane biogenesis n=1 Tax=Arboricoccus pini TaxID=1963835 RepID=A0A212QQ80_9PROT|nr:AsmA family protein [Arboricoccus pini]SNB61431.1 Uncharacterized protein involved in outer membrane biogenesis [Arboricoccus pini]
MRTFLWCLGLLLGLAACGIAALPLVIDKDAIRDIVQARVQARFGQDLTIEHGLSLRLLPTPVLSLHDVRWTTTLESGAPIELEAPRVDLHLSLLPLLQGRIGIERLTVQRPDLELGQLAPLDLLRSLADTIARTDDVDRVTIEDGQIRAPLALNVGDVPGNNEAQSENADLAERQFLLDSIVGDLWLDRATGAIEARMSGALAGQQLDAEVSSVLRVAPGVPIPFRGRLRASGDRLDMRFSGSATAQPSGLGAELDLDGRAPDLAALVVLLEPLLDDSWAAADFPTVDTRLKAHFSMDPAGWRLSDMALALAGTSMTGSLGRAWSDGGLSVDLEAARPDLAAGAPLRHIQAGPIGRALAAIPAQGTLRVTDLAWGGQTLREVKTGFAWTPNGTLTLEGMSATLPGNSRLDLAGTLKDRQLQGRVTLATADLPALLDWQGLKLPGLPEGRLRIASIEGAIEADSEHAVVEGARLRLDAAQGSGRLEWRFGQPGTLNLQAALDRLDFAFYRSLLQSAPAGFGLDLSIDRASLDSIGLGRVHLVIDGIKGQQELSALTIEDAAGLHLAIGTPEADGAQAVSLAVDRPARLAAAFGRDRLADLLVRASALAFRGSLRQDGGAIRLTLAGGQSSSGPAGWQADISAEADALADLGRARLNLALRAPTAAILLDEFGAPVAALGPGNVLATAPLEANLAVTPSETGSGRSLETSLTLGPMTEPTRLVSHAPLRLEEDDQGRLTVTGGLDLVDLGPAGPQMLRLAAASTSLPTGPAAAWLGSWPTSTLTVDWEDLPVLALGLDGVASIKTLRLGPEGLAIEGMDVPLMEGRLGGGFQVTPDDGAGLALAADLRLRAVEARSLLASADLTEALAGRIDLDMSLKAKGPTLAALVASTEGKGHVDGVDGTLLLGPEAPVSYGGLVGGILLNRGILSLQEGGLALGGEPPLPLSARIDLPAWLLDLKLGDREVSGTPRSAYLQ